MTIQRIAMLTAAITVSTLGAANAQRFRLPSSGQIKGQIQRQFKQQVQQFVPQLPSRGQGNQPRSGAPSQSGRGNNPVKTFGGGAIPGQSGSNNNNQFRRGGIPGQSGNNNLGWVPQGNSNPWANSGTFPSQQNGQFIPQNNGFQQNGRFIPSNQAFPQNGVYGQNGYVYQNGAYVQSQPFVSQGSRTTAYPSSTPYVQGRTYKTPPPLPSKTYSRLPIVIRCPDGQDGVCPYTLLANGKDYDYSISSGKRQTFKEDRDWTIRYTSGKGQELYKLRGGHIYVMQRDGNNNWQLYMQPAKKRVSL